MPDSVITVASGAVTYLNQPTYTWQHSDRATIDLELDIPGGAGADPVVFELTFPTATASGPGFDVTLFRGASSLRLVPPPAPNSTTFTGRRVTASVNPAGTNSTLSISVESLAGTVTNEAWTVRVRGLAAADCAFAK